jgi:hypothetical protein
MATKTATHVTAVLHLTALPPLTTEEFHERTIELMDQLVTLEECDGEIDDVDLAGDAGTSEISVEMAVRTEDRLYAMVKALSTIRAAIQATGGGTPNWPDVNDIKLIVDGADLELVSA